MTLEISTKFVMIAFCALIGSAVLLYLYQCWLFEYNASRCSEAKPREDYFETCTEKIDISAHQKMSEAILEYKAQNLRLTFGESIEKEVKRTKRPSSPPSAKPNKVMEKFKQRQNGK